MSDNLENEFLRYFVSPDFEKDKNTELAKFGKEASKESEADKLYLNFLKYENLPMSSFEVLSNGKGKTKTVSARSLTEAKDKARNMIEKNIAFKNWEIVS